MFVQVRAWNVEQAIYPSYLTLTTAEETSPFDKKQKFMYTGGENILQTGIWKVLTGSSKKIDDDHVTYTMPQQYALKPTEANMDIFSLVIYIIISHLKIRFLIKTLR